jgi:hypothetical protein
MLLRFGLCVAKWTFSALLVLCVLHTINGCPISTSWFIIYYEFVLLWAASNGWSTAVLGNTCLAVAFPADACT